MAVTQEDQAIDFDGAEFFLKEARESHERGDRTKFIAARKLVAIALRIDEARPRK